MIVINSIDSSEIFPPGLFLIVQDLFSMVQDYYSSVQDFYVIVQEFYRIVQDFLPLVQDFYPIVQDLRFWFCKATESRQRYAYDSLLYR